MCAPCSVADFTFAGVWRVLFPPNIVFWCCFESSPHYCHCMKNSSTKKLISRGKILRWLFFGNIINILLKLFHILIAIVTHKWVRQRGQETKKRVRERENKLLRVNQTSINYWIITSIVIDLKVTEVQRRKSPWNANPNRIVLRIFIFTSITNWRWFLRKRRNN